MTLTIGREIVVATILFLTVLGTLLTIANVGKERKPLSPGTAVASVIMATFDVVGVLWAVHVL